MMPKLQPDINLDNLLYHALVGMVLCSYSIPIYLWIAVTFPMNSGATAVVINIVAVVILVATLRPAWRWIQPRVHYVVFAMNDAQLEMMGQVSDSLTSASPEASMLGTIAETIARTIKLPYVRIKTVQGTAATYGTPPAEGEQVEIAIQYREEVVGWLEVASRLPQVPLSSSESGLLNSLARQVGITLHAAQMSEALQASREQLVLTREEERRRIRRDLHDGLGPTLASIKMQLSAVGRLIAQNPAGAAQLIGELQEDVSGATADIRRLVYELRPPMLDELGLVVALRNFKLGDSPLQLEVVAPEPMPALPAAVEVAVYRIATEAIHNVLKHAGATRCIVDIMIGAGELILRVTDDGRYQPESHRQTEGVGLRSMGERAAELGGRFSIQPAASGGALIEVSLPLESNRWTS